MRGNNVHLVPPLYDAGASEEYVKSGRTVTATWSARDDSLAVFSSPISRSQLNNIPGPSRTDREPTVYVAGMGPSPDHQRREFIADSSIVFTSFQRTMESIRQNDFSHKKKMLREMLTKHGIDFLTSAKGGWVTASEVTSQDPVYPADHYRAMVTSFDLFNILYQPDVGQEDQPVGEPLMDWLNRHFVDPPSEEGDTLSKLDRPWEHDDFWPYIARAVLRGLAKAPLFFLETLAQHPISEVRDCAELLGKLVAQMPRLTAFTSQKAYESARDAWLGQVRLAREALVKIPESARDDGFENWWNWISDMVGVMEGSDYILGDLCRQLGADWKDVVAARALFARKLPTRRKLPTILKQFGGRDEEDEVLSDSDVPFNFQPDPTVPEDMIHFYLVMGNMSATLSYSAQHDPWLAAHFALFMDEQGLLKAWNTKLGIDQRDHYVLEYADQLQSDPGLWRITVSYLYTCGQIGAERADQVLLHVPLQLGSAPAPDGMQEDSDAAQGSVVVGVLQELNEAARRYEREETRRSICKLAGRQFLARGDFDFALTYFGHAQDWAGLGRTIDRILDESLVQGPEYLIKQVQTCIGTVQNLLLNAQPIGIFAHRAAFARLYAAFFHDRRSRLLTEAAEYLVTMLRDGSAPKAWWGLLFLDGLELLQQNDQMVFTADEATDLLYKLQEIDTAVAQGAGDDYLAMLMKKHKLRGAKEAVALLRPVRLALARYMGRCHIVNTGGRDVSGLPARPGVVY